jgi:hypothetical protein
MVNGEDAVAIAGLNASPAAVMDSRNDVGARISKKPIKCVDNPDDVAM